MDCVAFLRLLEGLGYVATLIAPRLGDTEKVVFMLAFRFVRLFGISQGRELFSHVHCSPLCGHREGTVMQRH